MINRLLFGWNLAVGSMDSITGLLLMFMPASTLRLMGLQPVDDSAQIFLSWMGAFVFSVGISYFFVLLREDSWRGVVVWQMTALVRAVVAVFVLVKVAQGALEPLWLSVAATDAFVAIVQAIGIKQRWWQE